MSIVSRIGAVAAAFVFAVGSTASAGVLDGNALAFGGWTGSSAFDNGLASPSNFSGNVDYAVFTAADFNTAFPGATYAPTGALVYAYQVNVAGDLSLSVSLQLDALPSTDASPSWFQDNVSEVNPTAALFSGADATWLFNGQSVDPGESSAILVYSSNNLPELSATVNIDGGTPAVAANTPSPGDTPFPEPGTLALGAIGLATLALRRR